MEPSAITAAAKAYLPAMSRFLRELIAIPGESCREEQVCRRVEKEMLDLGYDRVEIDPLGNVLGFIGHGSRLIAYDGHIDTVGIGEAANWRFDPYQGYENAQEIGGRGASDQLGGIAAAVYGGKIIKDLQLLPDECQIMVSATVQEEDCDGLCWQYIIEEDGLRPEFVVLTEPTDGHIYRGQRGRMEIRVEVKGLSCHGSAPERGDNAIYKMAEIIPQLQELHQRLAYDPFLGKGSLAVSQIFFQSPSRCAVADMCAVSIDRRLTWGETWQNALAEIAALPAVQRHQAQVSLYRYQSPSWRGVIYPSDCYFPAWVLPPDHPALQATVAAFQRLYQQPQVGKWTFSTNGVSIMGRYGIPCVGLGPGREDQAHAANEITWKDDLVRCAAVYAAIPHCYCGL